MKKVLMGNHAASHGVRLGRVQVIAAYPITPQTQIVEELSEICAKGELAAKFLKVESEHSAMASIIGAASAGARCFTATSSHGLALMHEMLHWAAGARLPLVMVNVNRALGPGWNIWTDQSDSLSQRDTGWLQFYVEDNQEVLDTVIQAYKLAERINLPVMICYDAFILSHTYEPVDVPSQEEVDAFLPPPAPRAVLDVADPHAFNALAMPDAYFEMRYKMERAMDEARTVFPAIDAEWKERFGRGYGAVEGVALRDAEVVLCTSATMTSMARLVVEKLRAEGVKLGLLKIKMFRPFPTREVREALAGRERAIVVDRNLSFGKGGIFADEIRGAIADDPRRPPVFGVVTGLGGRDVTTDAIEEIVRDGMRLPVSAAGGIVWKGVRL
jgi:pyruvate/2-oxoacid:ferredoxin oxidoreductase alpha subunit